MTTTILTVFSGSYTTCFMHVRPDFWFAWQGRYQAAWMVPTDPGDQT